MNREGRAKKDDIRFEHCMIHSFESGQKQSIYWLVILRLLKLRLAQQGFVSSYTDSLP